MTARELLDKDQFWKEDEGAGDEECEAFESGITKMRKDKTSWNEGKGKQPEWLNTDRKGYTDEKSEAETPEKHVSPIVAVKEEGILSSHPGRAKAGKMTDEELGKWIDDELSCLNLGLLESWLPGAPKKGGMSESSY